MKSAKNYYISLLYAALIPYVAYSYLWNTFGLGVTYALQVVLLGLLILGSLRYVFKNNYGNSFQVWLYVLMLFQLFAYFFSGSSASTQFKEVLFVLLVGAPFASEVYDAKRFKFVYLTMAIISVAMFYYNISLMRLVDENSYGGGYMALVALPAGLYFLRNKSLKVQAVWASIIYVIVLTSMKRGDILACTLSIVVYFIVYFRSKGKLNYKSLLLLAILALVGYMAIDYLAQTSDVFAWRLQQTRDGDSSERDFIYGGIWHHFQQASFFEQFFGSGFDATVKIVDTRAHSDWLETLACEGIAGCLVYAACMYSLYRQATKRTDIGEKAILFVVLTIWAVKSVFSMFIFSQSTILLFILTGYIINKKIDKQYEY